MKQFTSINDVSDLSSLLSKGQEIAQNPYDYSDIGKNKTLGILFFNPSLRTRLSTQKAAMNLGMQVMVMNFNEEGWQIEMQDGSIMNQGSQEHIKEAASVVSQYCDIIGIRTFASLKDKKADYEEYFLNKFIQHTSVPVISLESATLHPLQSFADLLTIEKFKKKKKPKVVLTWAPHPRALPQAVANSFLEWTSKMPYDLVITHPKGFELNEVFTKGISIEENQNKALADADFVYAKNWSSYENYGMINEEDFHWQITKEKMSLTNNAYFMHCLPVRRNVVVSDDVMDSANSLTTFQAEQRVYAAQAVLHQMLMS